MLSAARPLARMFLDVQLPDEKVLREIQRLIAKVPSIAAYAWRHSLGLPYVYPDAGLTYTGNFTGTKL